MSGPDFIAAHPDPVVQYTTDEGRVGIRRVNPAFETTFGLDPEAEAVTLGDTLAADDDIAAVADAIASGTDLSLDLDCATADGERRFRLRNVPAADGGFLLYTDVDDLAARVETLEAENDHLEAFASVVSHDLRNPIEVARTYLQEARDRDDEEPLERVDDALDRMRTLVDDVLALAREGQAITATERTNLAAAVTDAWASVDTAAATLSVADEAATLQADPTRFQQALENLFRNAVEHGSTGNRNVERPGDATEHAGTAVTVTVGTIGDGDGTGFFVADDGPGVPPEERGAVFEPGHTSTTDGTGLGLAIVDRIVDAHGWEVTVTESDAGGARFEVTGVDSLQPF